MPKKKLGVGIHTATRGCGCKGKQLYRKSGNSWGLEGNVVAYAEGLRCCFWGGREVEACVGKECGAPSLGK